MVKSIKPALMVMVLVVSSQVFAEEAFEIPKEELARESVLPRYDRPDSVRNRNVLTEKRMELGGYWGWNFTEPIYNQTKIGFNFSYHLSEDRAVNVNFSKWMSGLNSQYVPAIEEKGSLDFSRVPALEWSLWGNYEFKSYYGKISLTKQGVMNLFLYPLVGAGVTKYVHKLYPGVNGGVGQKFYFTKDLALRIDFKLQLQQTPNPFLKGGLAKSLPTKPDPSEFSDRLAFDTVMDVGMSYLF